MQLHTAEMRVLDVGPGRAPFEAKVQLRFAVDGASSPVPSSPDWMRLTLDHSADWEDAAVVRGRRLRDTRR